jgi:O-antigen/teichoic acid export membrane protein
MFGGLIVGMWVARYLGPKDYGVLNYALAYTALFMIFVKIGLDQIMVREIVKNPSQSNYLLGTSFGLKIIGSIIALISIYVSLFFVKTDVITKTVIFIIGAGFIFQSLNVIDYFYQAKVLSRQVVIARNSAFIICSILKVYLIVNDHGVIYFAFIYVLEILLAGLFLVFIYKRNSGIIKKWRFSKKTAVRLLKFTWPLALSSFLISIHMRIDQVMIGNILSNSDVGVYSVAVRLAQFWMFIPGILVSTLMPYFIDLREKNNELYHYRLIQLYSLMFWMGACVGVVTIIFGKDIIGLLYGEAYREAYKALVFNIWAGLFMAQSYAKGIWVISENKQLYRIIANVAAVIINITLNLILIPSYLCNDECKNIIQDFFRAKRKLVE